jgi:hypothetical protein
LTDCGVTVADLDDMVIQGFQTVWFGVGLYRGFCDHVGVDGRSVIPDHDIKAAISYLLDEGTGFEHVSHLDRLMAILSRASDADYVEEGVHYTMMNPRGEDTPDSELCIRIDSAFDKVRQYCRDHDVKESDILNSSDDYRPRARDNEAQGGYVTNTSKASRFEALDGIRRTIAFDLDGVAETVDDFAAGAFDSDETDTGDDEPVALAGRDLGYMHEFTATIASVNAGEYDREVQGKLKGDVKGAYIGYVMPGGNDEYRIVNREGDRLRFKNVTIRKNDSDLREAVIDNTVEISEVPSTDDGSGAMAAQTDGDGFDTEDDSIVEELMRAIIDTVMKHAGDSGAAHQAVIDDLTDDYASQTIEDGIQKALDEGRIYQSGTRSYRHK